MTEGLTTIPLPPQRSLSGILSIRYPPRGGAAAARRAHNPEVVGSSPTPATKTLKVGADLRPPLLTTHNAQLTTKERSWWPERGGPTRSHPEHGSETPQRPRYCPGNRVWKIGRCRELFSFPLANVRPSRLVIPSRGRRATSGLEGRWISGS